MLARFLWLRTAPALPRATTTATATGAAPPPCQLLDCNGDWAAAAEVTPGRGSGARPALDRTAESLSSGGGLLRGRGGVFLPLLSSRRQAESRESIRGGQPARPRRGEARPGSPGVSRGGVTAPSARPRGMHRGSRRRRRHSQVSCGKTWRGPGTLAPTPPVRGSRFLVVAAREAGRGPLALPGVPFGEPPWSEGFWGDHPETSVSYPAGACQRRNFFAYCQSVTHPLPPTPVYKEVRYLSPLVSRSGCIPLAIEHVLGNSGKTIPVAG